jgi:hypothetical protein
MATLSACVQACQAVIAVLAVLILCDVAKTVIRPRYDVVRLPASTCAQSTDKTVLLLVKLPLNRLLSAGHWRR